MTVLLSVITVTRNNGSGLSKTVHSCERLLANPQVEVVIVDGASTDDTSERLDALKVRADRRVVIVSEPDRGIYDAMNKGLRLAKGRHVIFMNAGDQFLESLHLDPSTLRPDTTYYGDGEFRSETGGFLKRYSIGGVHSFMSHNTFCHQAIFYPRALLLELGSYDLSYKVSADFDLTLKCFLRKKFRSLGVVVCVCELGGFSHVNGWRSYRDRTRSFKAHGQWSCWLLLMLYAPVFYLKHRAVKALDGTRLLSWYRSLRYR